DSTMVSDSNYLDKIYDLYDDGTGMDTQDVFTVHYDNLKRVTVITDSVVNDPGLGLFEAFHYYYNSADTLPYKSVERGIITSGALDTTTIYHFYDAQKRNLKDSMMGSINGDSYKRIVDFSYAPGKLYGQTIETANSPLVPATFTRDTADIDAYGSITNNKKYFFNGTDYTIHTVATFTYDNHLNPFVKLGIFKAHKNFPSGETLFFDYMGYNNIISVDEIVFNAPGPNGNKSIQNYNYNYNSSGFPLIINKSYVGYSGSGNEKIIFEYKAL
ncbi:MAG: hypothetical protein ABJA37_13015, partial [Ferruginibacter sp.]